MATRKTAAKKAPARKSTPARPMIEVVEVIEVGTPPIVAQTPVPEKQKLVRDSFTMPKAEYELLASLKSRLLDVSRAVKKSELLRAGVVLLASLPDAALLAAVDRIPSLKTGRPGKVRVGGRTAKKKA